MNRVFYLVLCLLIILPPQQYSQVKKAFGTMPYRHYTTIQGLPGSNVLAFYQDKKGYVWFATSSGLSRFDGHDFNNFTTNEGLLSNNLTGVDGNENDSLFISTYDKGIDVFYNGVISHYEILNSQIPLIHHLISTGNQLFIYSDYLYQVFNNRIKDMMPENSGSRKTTTLDFQITNATKTSNGTLLFASSQGIIGITKTNKYSRNLITPNNIITSVCEGNKKTLWFGGYGKIWLKENGVYKQAFKDISIPSKYPIQNLAVDANNNLWFSQANGNIYIIKENKLINIGAYLELQGTQVNFIKKDNDGNIWVGTYGKGIYCFFNLSVTNYSTKDKLSNAFVISLNEDSNGRLLVGTFNGLNVFGNRKFVEIPIGYKGDYHYIRSIQKVNNNLIYVAGSYDLKYNRQNKKVASYNFKNTYFRFINCAALFALSNNSIVVGGWDNKILFNRVTNDGIFIKREIKIFNNSTQNIRVNSIKVDSRGNYWIGSTKGLCKIRNKKQSYFPDNPILSNNINDIEIDKTGTVWLAGDKGISKYSEGEWANYPKSGNFDLSSSNSITFDRDGNTWIGNSKGLFKIRNDSISYYTDLLGLKSYEINTVFYDSLKNNLWVGTVDGLSKINLKIFNKIKTIVPYVYIEQVETSDSTYSISPGINLPDFDQRKITVRFSAINFRNPENLVFEYTNGNNNSDWEVTDQTEIQFASLYPGNNTIYIRARNLNGVWSKPALVTLYIKTPFLKSYWFYALVMIALLIPALFITRKIIEKRQVKVLEKRDIEKRIIELKQQAMSAMMNPHFIFNSLNSIQNFINNHGKKEANLYLTSFSRLIRLNLDLAQNSYVNLQDELERLTLYLKLEKIRFGEGFTYSITIDESVNASEILIPNMVIQPFVENGIWHGILPNNKSGQLSVSIRFNPEKDLIIEITDDGIGYFVSIKNKKSEHVPRGISIIKERLNLLNITKNRSDLVQIESSIDQNSNPNGTRVKITLPSEMYLIETDE